MEDLFSRISADIGDAALAASITAGLREVYASPPCGALELLLCRAVPESVARELLFTPSASSECGIGLYPQLIPSAPVGSGPEHPRRRLQPASLTLLALVHLRSWPLAAAFVREGGLRSLCGLLLDPNLHLRGQALDCFLQITSHPAYDWFAPPSGAEDDRALHSGVLALAQPVAGSATGAAAVPFLAALLQNWDCPGPGVSFNALQLLAWWLSFVRAIHTSPARPLQVSQALLQGLQRWAERPSGTTPGQSSTQEEAALAAKVHADFSRFAIPPAEEAAAAAQEPAVKGLAALPASAAAAQTRAPSSELLREEGHATGEGLPALAAPAPSAEAAAAACKEQGNAHFRGERWAEATAQYSAGIALLEGAPLTTTTTDALLALLSNRALSRLRGAGYGGGLLPHPSLPALLQAAVPAAQLRALLAQGSAGGLAALLAAATQPAARAALAGLFGSLSDCERALALAPGHRKVLLRRAQVALVLGDGASALASARCAVAACGREGGGGDKEALRSATAFLTHAIAAQAQAQAQGGGRRRGRRRRTPFSLPC